MKYSRGYEINGTHYPALHMVITEFQIDKDQILQRCVSFEWPGWQSAEHQKGKGRFTIEGVNFVSITAACRHHKIHLETGRKRVSKASFPEWIDNQNKSGSTDLGIENIVRRKAKIVPRDVYIRLMKLDKKTRRSILDGNGKGTTLPTIRNKLDVIDGLRPSGKVFTFEDLTDRKN